MIASNETINKIISAYYPVLLKLTEDLAMVTAKDSSYNINTALGTVTINIKKKYGISSESITKC